VGPHWAGFVWGFVDAELAKLDEHDEMVKEAADHARAQGYVRHAGHHWHWTVVRRLSRLNQEPIHVIQMRRRPTPPLSERPTGRRASSSRSDPAPAAEPAAAPAQRVNRRPSRSPQPFLSPQPQPGHRRRTKFRGKTRNAQPAAR